MPSSPSMGSSGGRLLDRIAAVNSSISDTCEVKNRVDSGWNVLEITLVGVPVTVNDTGTFGTVKIADLPEGILAFGPSTANLTFTTTSTLSSTLNASKQFVWSFGTTTAASSASLVGGKSNVIAPTFATSSATISVANTATTGRAGSFGMFSFPIPEVDALANSQRLSLIMPMDVTIFDFPVFYTDTAIAGGTSFVVTTAIGNTATDGGLFAFTTHATGAAVTATGLRAVTVAGTAAPTIAAGTTLDMQVSAVTGTYTAGSGKILVPYYTYNGLGGDIVDGSATAADLFLNIGVPLATDIDGDATVTVSGNARIFYRNLLDV